MSPFPLVLIFILSLFPSAVTFGQDNGTQEFQDFKANLHPDAFEQSLRWEETQNFSPYRQTTKFWPMAHATVPIEKVLINPTSGFSNRFRQELISPDYSSFYFPIHPLASAKGVVGQAEGPREKNGIVRFTASRSLYYYLKQGDLPLFQVKLPTDYLFNPERPQDFNSYFHHQFSKMNLLASTVISPARTHHVERVDEEIGTDPQLEVLKEVAAIQYVPTPLKRPLNGMIVRDIGPLTNGNYFLPAFSIPFVGRKLAQIHGEDFATFWGKAYAQALGRTKAKILLRYGLQLYTPNAQNFLLEIDKETLRPTGKVVVRDLGDSRFVEPVMKGLHPNSYWLAFDRHKMHAIDKYLHPYWSNSIWRFDQEGDDMAGGPVSPEILEKWGQEHHQAYLDEMNAALKTAVVPLPQDSSRAMGQVLLNLDLINIQQKKMILLADPVDIEEMRFVTPLQKFLSTSEGREKLKSYRLQLLQNHQNQKLTEGESFLSPPGLPCRDI